MLSKNGKNYLFGCLVQGWETQKDPKSQTLVITDSVLIDNEKKEIWNFFDIEFVFLSNQLKY